MSTDGSRLQSRDIRHIEGTAASEYRCLMYQRHPSAKLQDLFKAKPYQGAPPETAEFVFVGLDANYAADIERKEDVFKLVDEYHEDGVRFWRDKGHHHPFLVNDYRGSGRRYHETFAEIGLVRNDASRVSFIELLHVPTVGVSELERADFDVNHLDRINRLIVSEQPRHIFVSSKVVALMRQSKRFGWLRGKRPNFEELPILYKEGFTTVYQIYHFSAWADVADSMRMQARAILRLARANDGDSRAKETFPIAP